MTSPDLAAAAEPRSDQINADDMIAGPRLITITEVRRGNSEQPIEIVTAEFGPGRPWRPSKSMIRVLLAAWGDQAQTYTGRKLMLYRDPEVKFGGQAVGGIRISAMSHIDQRMSISLTVTRGRRSPFIVEPLPAGPQLVTDSQAEQFVDDIGNATDRTMLDAIAAQLRTVDLGAHRDRLGQLWKHRAEQVATTTESRLDAIDAETVPE